MTPSSDTKVKITTSLIPAPHVASTLRAEATTGSPIRQTDPRRVGFIESFIAMFQTSLLALLACGNRSERRIHAHPSKDYERKVQASETFIEVAMIRLILRRQAR